MRFRRMVESGKDQDVPVFEFAFGTDELRLLLGICKTSRRNMPDMFEIKPTKSRLSNIIHRLEDTLNRYQKGEIKINKKI